MRWWVVLPVKRLDEAKTRLHIPHRADVALAMALDTAEAAGQSPVVAGVIAVTDDQRAAVALAQLGALVVEDAPNAGLNPALRHGASVARSLGADGGVAALSADLPALRPEELTRALVAAQVHTHAVVADAAGAGTTLYAAAPGATFSPRFGPESLARHVEAGAVRLDLDAIDGLCRDVDTAADLHAAHALGVGRHTAAVTMSKV